MLFAQDATQEYVRFVVFKTHSDCAGCVIRHQQEVRSLPFSSVPDNPGFAIIFVFEYSPVP